MQNFYKCPRLNLIILAIIAVLVVVGADLFVRPQVSGRYTSEKEIEALFDHWSESLQTGDPHKVTALYAKRSIFLPTLSDKVRLTPNEKEDYFRHFLTKQPSAKIDFRRIDTGKDMAVDSGLYTFTFAKTGEIVRGRYSFTYKWDGKNWLIVSHHSSLLPGKK